MYGISKLMTCSGNGMSVEAAIYRRVRGARHA